MAAKSSGLLAEAAEGDTDAIADLAEYSLLAGKAIDSGLITETELAEKGFAALDEKVQELTQNEMSGIDLSESENAFLDFANNVNTALEGIKGLAVGEIIPQGELSTALGEALNAVGAFNGSLSDLADAAG
jgi:hypothetical protein